jgi:hypothetical protein
MYRERVIIPKGLTNREEVCDTVQKLNTKLQPFIEGDTDVQLQEGNFRACQFNNLTQEDLQAIVSVFHQPFYLPTYEATTAEDQAVYGDPTLFPNKSRVDLAEVRFVRGEPQRYYLPLVRMSECSGQSLIAVTQAFLNAGISVIWEISIVSSDETSKLGRLIVPGRTTITFNNVMAYLSPSQYEDKAYESIVHNLLRLRLRGKLLVEESGSYSFPIIGTEYKICVRVPSLN